MYLQLHVPSCSSISHISPLNTATEIKQKLRSGERNSLLFVPFWCDKIITLLEPWVCFFSIFRRWFCSISFTHKFWVVFFFFSSLAIWQRTKQTRWGLLNWKQSVKTEMKCPNVTGWPRYSSLAGHLPQQTHYSKELYGELEENQCRKAWRA